MSAASLLAYRLARGGMGHAAPGVQIQRGEDAIFGEGPYPRRMTEFIGQEDAKLQLLTAMTSAVKRNVPMDHVLLASGTPGIGKGQPLTAEILTPTGWRLLGSLQVGDFVIGANGQPTEITGVFDRGELPVFEVEFSDGARVVCDGDHLWQVETRKKSTRVISTTDLLTRGVLDRAGHARYKIPLVEPVAWDKPLLPIHPYLLGVLLANGHLSGTPCIRTNDVEIIDRIRQLSPGVIIRESTSANSTARGWYVRGMRDQLRMLGLYDSRSTTKFIPVAYLFADIDSRLELLRGLLDSDGSVRPHRRTPLYFTGSPQLAYGVRHLVESLGGTVSVNSYDNRGAREYHVGISLDMDVFTLPRKACIAQTAAARRTIRAIRPVGAEVVRCLKVAAPDSLYVTERFVVTHNTTLAKILAAMSGRGYVEVGGNVTLKEIRPILEAMSTGDVLFLDEIHRLVSVKRTNAEWLLQLLTDFRLVLPSGTIQLPRITVIAATTDAQRLPRTILDRFLVQPVLEPYTTEQAVEIAKVTAKRLDLTLEPAQLHRVAAAGDYNPRVMGRLLTAIRDIQLSGMDTPDPLGLALRWTGVSADGLGRVEQDYLLALVAYGGTASIGTIKAVLSETALDQTERSLIQKGFITIQSRGRELTRLGLERARELLAEQEDA